MTAVLSRIALRYLAAALVTAGYAEAFEKALVAASYSAKKVPPSGTEPAPAPKPAAAIEQGPVPSGNWLAALLKFLATLLKGKK